VHLPDADVHVITAAEHIGGVSAESDREHTLHALGGVHFPGMAPWQQARHRGQAIGGGGSWQGGLSGGWVACIRHTNGLQYRGEGHFKPGKMIKHRMIKHSILNETGLNCNSRAAAACSLMEPEGAGQTATWRKFNIMATLGVNMQALGACDSHNSAESGEKSAHPAKILSCKHAYKCRRPHTCVREDAHAAIIRACNKLPSCRRVVYVHDG